MPGQAAISSTPATASRHRSLRGNDTFTSQDSDATPSWSASLESPLIRLDRDIRSLESDDQGLSFASSSMAHHTLRLDETADLTQRPTLPELKLPAPQFNTSGKGQARASPLPLRENVLRRNASATADPGQSKPVSPLKIKAKTPIPKKYNPYIPENSKPSDWKGVVDLSDPSVTSPLKQHPPPSLSRYRPAPLSSTRKASAATTPKKDLEDDDSFDFGMSPPITMDFARLPKLGQTPRKAAAERIMKDLLDVERRGAFGGPSSRGTAGLQHQRHGGTESSTSSVPTPPSLSRYGNPSIAESSGSVVVDTSMESLMGRVGAGTSYIPSRRSLAGPSAAALTSGSSFSLNPLPSSSATAYTPLTNNPSTRSHNQIFKTPDVFQYDQHHVQDDSLQPPSFTHAIHLHDDHDHDPDSSLDSSFDDDEVNNTANPSAAFILASQRGSYEEGDSSSDQSMDSDVGDGIEGEEGSVPVHPFARGLSLEDGEGEFEDSFDDDDLDVVGGGGAGDGEEETLFGVPPARREAAMRARESEVRMLGGHLVGGGDTDTIGSHGGVHETPTPWPGNRQ